MMMVPLQQLHVRPLADHGEGGKSTGLPVLSIISPGPAPTPIGVPPTPTQVLSTAKAQCQHVASRPATTPGFLSLQSSTRNLSLTPEPESVGIMTPVGISGCGIYFRVSLVPPAHCLLSHVSPSSATVHPRPHVCKSLLRPHLSLTSLIVIYFTSLTLLHAHLS